MKDRVYSIVKILLMVLCLFGFSYNLFAKTAGRPALQITHTDSNSLTLEFNLPSLQIKKRSLYGQTFDLLEFDGASYLRHEGLPVLPVFFQLIGIPPEITPVVTVLADEQTNDLKYSILPYQQEHLLQSKKHNKLVIDRDFYRQRRFYPAEVVKVEPIGYIRQQRVGRLKIHPIQYNPGTKQIRIHRRLVVRINYNMQSTIPEGVRKRMIENSRVARAPAEIGTIRNPQSAIRNRDNPFEQLFRTSLINYEQAKKFRAKRQSRDIPLWYVPGAVPQSSIAMGPVRISRNDETPAYKLVITDTGLYKLTYRMLKKAGASFSDVDVNSIKMFSEGQEVSIYVHGEKDGSFDEGDYIVFYGKAIVDSKFTDENVYVLSWGGNKALRPAIISGKPKTVMKNEESAKTALSPPTPTVFKTVEHFEIDRWHDPLVSVKSELVDHYFWAGFTGGKNGTVADFPLRLPYSAKPLNKKAIIRLRFQGISFVQNEKHSALIKFNLIPLSELSWNRQENRIFEVKMPQNYISPSDTNFLTIESKDMNSTPKGKIDFYLDWFEIEYWHTYQANAGRLEFSSNRNVQKEKIRYEIRGFRRPEIDLFEIGEKGVIAKIINGVVEEENAKFRLVVETHPAILTKYYAVQKSSYRRPKLIKKFKSAGLRNPSNQADYIIISHEDFIDSIERLAEFRRQSGLKVLIVDVEEIYNEFSNGLFNPMAIKSFLRYAYKNWVPPKPSYVLLVGDAHWDYKDATEKYYRNALGVERNIPPIFVPTYHGWSPEGGETAMDQKFVEVSGDDALPDMFIGRLPVQTSSELDAVVEKIIDYEQNKKTGVWQSRIMQIADNDADNAGDEKFQNSREALVRKVIPPSVETRKVYLKEIVSPYRTKQSIINNMREGVVVMEYSGHGGADSWAHEGIFMIGDVQSVRNELLPFVVTTTCLNGIFDKPLPAGNRVFSEEFVLIKDHGAVANLSATRLTFADANAAFDADLFRNMFAVKPPVIGAVINAAKVDFITKQGDLWWPNVEQYTLFGDPATVLSLPQLEIKINIKDKSLSASQKIIITPNVVGQNSSSLSEVGGEKFIKAEDFNANLMLSVIYPNNLDKIADNDLPVFRKTVPVWNGEYGEIKLDISDKVIPGEGILRMFASDGKRSAIGGVKFSMYNPVILSIVSEFSEDEEFLSINVEIADNSGASGIQKVSCKWRNTVNFKTNVTEMTVKDSSDDSKTSWYKLSELIPLPKGGKKIKYIIIVEDDEGNHVESSEHTVKAPIGANLAISRYPDSGSPMIAYEYSDKHKTWILKAQLENNGGKHLKEAIWVYFFEGNPDFNGDGIVDEASVSLGKVRISVDKWKQLTIPSTFLQTGGQQSVIETVSAELILDKPLESGYHNIYVWADPELPEYDHEDYIDGEIPEPFLYDNKADSLFPINDFILMDEDLTAYSLDNILEVFFPSGATDPATISISSIPLLSQKGDANNTDTVTGDSLQFKQPDVVPATVPGKTEHSAFSIKLSSDVKRLQKSASATIKFDMAKFRDEIIKKTGIETEPQLSAQLKKEADKLSIYSWMPEIEMWRRLDSQLLVNENNEVVEKKYISSPVSENATNQIISRKHIKIDPNITPLGEWVILFLDNQHFQVILKRNEADTYDVLERQGKVGEIYRNEMAGIELNIPDPKESAKDTLSANVGNLEFEFGDTFYFRTSFNSYYGITKVQSIRNYNHGEGSVHIEIEDESSNTQLLSSAIGNWLIFFRNSEEYEVRDKHNRPLKFSYGSTIYGKVNRPSRFPSLGIEVNINPGKRGFNFGDKFKFKITEVGEISAKIDRLSTISLMRNNDTTPPNVQLWVNGSEAKSSSVIPPRPEISLLISDNNGIDINSFSLSISKNNGEFQDVPEDDYILNNQLTTVTIRYTPILYIGKYFYRISVADLNRNKVRTDLENDSDDKDYLEYLFFVEEQPDLTSPSISVEVSASRPGWSFSALNDGDVLTEPSIFHVIITDEHGIEPDSVIFSLSPVASSDDFSLNPISDQNYDFDFNKKDPTRAVITYKPDLRNGDYQIQVEASDTSKNTQQLQTQFSMDEPVAVSNLFNAPNPFSGDTVFVYELTQIPDDVTIKIYTLTGRLIKTIEMASSRPHYNEQYWDGRDENGDRLANGTYLYKFIVQTEDKRIVKYGKFSVLR